MLSQIMPFVLFLIYGTMVGALARLIAPDDARNGWVPMLVAGVAGAYLSGIVGCALGVCRSPQSTTGCVVPLIGAIAGVLIHRTARARLARRRQGTR